MTDLGTVAIVGLGLIGGSLARDLAARGVRVLGGDLDPATLRAAHDEGVLAASRGPELNGIEEADALVIAVPVVHAPELLEAASPRLRHLRFITDVGSTKGRMVATAERLEIAPSFVGGHPLAGSHQGGWQASRAGLFEGARVFLSPTAATGEAALSTVRALWDAVGARVHVIDATEHDRLLAWLSHLPQSVSTALALTLAGESIRPAELGPGGQGMTRLAASCPDLWTGIALENAAALVPAIRALGERLQAFGDALERRDAKALGDFFAAGQEWCRR